MTALRSTAVRLVILAFLVYNANLRPNSSADTFPARYLPISILREGDFDLDEFRFLRDSAHVATYGLDGVPYYLRYRRGHYMSTIPVAPAVLATPVYAVPVALGFTADRPTVVVFATVLFLYVLHAPRRHVVRFLAFPVVVAVLLAAYNLYYFGSPLGGYSVIQAGSTYGQFGGSPFGRLLGLLVSPSRGLLACSPVLLFAGVGIARAATRPRDSLVIAIAVASGLTVVLYSFFSAWHGEFGYTYRYLVELLPGLCLALGIAWPWITARRWRLSAFAAAAAFSVFVQVIGAFYHPCDRFAKPVRAADHPERFWSVRDAEVVRCLRAGPVYPDALRLVGRAAHR